MKGFKQCERGHFYKNDLDKCPYCPSTQDSGEGAKTKISGEGKQGGVDNRTQIAGAGSGSPSAKVNVNPAMKRDLSKTYIQDVEQVEEGGVKKEVVKQRPDRKIVGWLVSYTLDPMGIDFRIFEGNNSIGRSVESDICVIGDPSVSSKHATMLFKKGKCYVRDEMAANGTFINGEELEIGQPTPLKDGDELKVGNTIFTYKTPF